LHVCSEGVYIREVTIPGAVGGLFYLSTLINQQSDRLAVARLKTIRPSQIENGQRFTCDRVGQLVHVLTLRKSLLNHPFIAFSYDPFFRLALNAAGNDDDLSLIEAGYQ
jgi:hypothetical protein